MIMRAFRLMVGLVAFHTWFSTNRRNILAGLSLLYLPVVIGAGASYFWPPAYAVGMLVLGVSVLFLIQGSNAG